MRELGSGSTAEHEDLGRLAVRLNVSRVVAVGEGTQPIHDAAQQKGAGDEGPTWVRDVDAAHELLRQELRPGDVVLVKSSHDAGLRLLGDRLVDDGLMDNS